MVPPKWKLSKTIELKNNISVYLLWGRWTNKKLLAYCLFICTPYLISHIIQLKIRDIVILSGYSRLHAELLKEIVRQGYRQRQQAAYEAKSPATRKASWILGFGDLEHLKLTSTNNLQYSNRNKKGRHIHIQLMISRTSLLFLSPLSGISLLANKTIIVTNFSGHTIFEPWYCWPWKISLQLSI